MRYSPPNYVGTRARSAGKSISAGSQDRLVSNARSSIGERSSVNQQIVAIQRGIVRVNATVAAGVSTTFP
jgi:hypothetical protein